MKDAVWRYYFGVYAHNHHSADRGWSPQYSSIGASFGYPYRCRDRFSECDDEEVRSQGNGFKKAASAIICAQTGLKNPEPAPKTFGKAKGQAEARSKSKGRTTADTKTQKKAESHASQTKTQTSAIGSRGQKIGAAPTQTEAQTAEGRISIITKKFSEGTKGTKSGSETETRSDGKAERERTSAFPDREAAHFRRLGSGYYAADHSMLEDPGGREGCREHEGRDPNASQPRWFSRRFTKDSGSGAHEKGAIFSGGRGERVTRPSRSFVRTDQVAL